MGAEAIGMATPNVEVLDSNFSEQEYSTTVTDTSNLNMASICMRQFTDHCRRRRWILN